MKRLGLAVLLVFVGHTAHALEGVRFTHSPGSTFPDPLAHALRGDLPAIVNFDYMFTNGDHRIRRMFTYPQRPYWGSFLDPALIFDMRDQNSDDPFDSTVSWIDLRQHALRSVGGTCGGGTCRWSIPALPAGDTITLMGWKFELFNGNEMNVRQLSIVPNPQAGYIDVTLNDDGGGHAYQVTVYYARLVALEIQSINALTSSAPARDTVTVARVPGRAVLSGFRLRFPDAAHFLERWSVELCPDGTGTTPCREDRMRLRFRDIDGADNFDWWVRYTNLQPWVEF